MSKLQELNAIVRADVSGLKKDMKKAEKTWTDYAKQSKDTYKEIRNLWITGKIIDGIKSIGNAIVDAGKQLVEFTKSGFDASRELNNQAAILNWSAGALGNWQYAAAQAGLEGDQFFEMISELNIRLGEARNSGSGPVADWFKTANLDIKEFINLDPQARLKRIADITKDLGSQAEKAAFMSALFSDTGAEKGLAFFDQGAEKIGMTIEEAERLGVTLTDTDRNAIQVANESMMKFSATMARLAEILALAVSPAIFGVTDALDKQLASTDNVKGKTQAWIEDLVVYMATGIDVLQKFLGVLQATIVLFEGFALAGGLAAKAAALVMDPMDLSGMHKSIDEFNEAMLSSMSTTFESASVNLSWKEENRAGLGLYKSMLESQPAFADAVKAKDDAASPEGAGDFSGLPTGPTKGQSALSQLEEQLNLLRLGADEVERRKLIEEGASSAEIKRLDHLKEMIELEKERQQAAEDAEKARLQAIEDQKRSDEQAMDTAKRYLEMIETDEQKLAYELEQAKAFFESSGLIDEAKQNEILDKIKSNYAPDAADPARNTVDAVEFGSSAAASMIARGRAGRSTKGAEEKVADNTETLVTETKKTNKLLALLTGDGEVFAIA